MKTNKKNRQTIFCETCNSCKIDLMSNKTFLDLYRIILINIREYLEMRARNKVYRCRQAIIEAPLAEYTLV